MHGEGGIYCKFRIGFFQIFFPFLLGHIFFGQITGNCRFGRHGVEVDEHLCTAICCYVHKFAAKFPFACKRKFAHFQYHSFSPLVYSAENQCRFLCGIFSVYKEKCRKVFCKIQCILLCFFYRTEVFDRINMCKSSRTRLCSKPPKKSA